MKTMSRHKRLLLKKARQELDPKLYKDMKLTVQKESHLMVTKMILDQPLVRKIILQFIEDLENKGI